MFTMKNFEILDKEYEKIRDWDKTHECMYKPKNGVEKYSGAIGGHLSIEFTPTSIGMLVKVICGCGKELIVRNL
ncbi:MAG: hypothetical protein K0R54_512 [Clostridiaceae bacterium]|jgi:hypothetical protein|nr:hypothetical protein [Clostridiaceae bacterium]